MIRAELRQLHSPDLLDLENSIPPDPEQFGILVQALVGPLGEAGEESFDFVVCTLSWLNIQIARDEYRFARGHLLVRYYSYKVIKSALEKLCGSVSGSDWTSVAQKLARYGQWEFEDYQPPQS